MVADLMLGSPMSGTDGVGADGLWRPLVDGFAGLDQIFEVSAEPASGE